LVPAGWVRPDCHKSATNFVAVCYSGTAPFSCSLSHDDTDLLTSHQVETSEQYKTNSLVLMIPREKSTKVGGKMKLMAVETGAACESEIEWSDPAVGEDNPSHSSAWN
jgi:hypothetical protein